MSKIGFVDKLPHLLPAVDELVEMTLAPLGSKNSRVTYRGYIKKFLYATIGQTINREVVAAYQNKKRDEGASLSSQIQMAKAIRHFATESWCRGMMSESDYRGILSLKLPKMSGVSRGKWLDIEDVNVILAAPNLKTESGIRDFVMLALLVGCGLRREEAATIEWTSYQRREGRMCLVDFVGKGNRIRTVPVPS
jgi:site-specific recombinase XerD